MRYHKDDAASACGGVGVSWMWCYLIGFAGKERLSKGEPALNGL